MVHASIVLTMSADRHILTKLSFMFLLSLLVFLHGTRPAVLVSYVLSELEASTRYCRA